MMVAKGLESMSAQEAVVDLVVDRGLSEPASLTVSVGICAYNEEENIGPLLSNLLAEQDLPQTSEIIVVCSGCTDRTPEVVEDFARKEGRVKLILETERRGKASALNRLLSTYRGEVFVHLDADHIPEPGAINMLLRNFSDPEIGGVSGHQIPIRVNSFMGKVCETIWGLHSETQRYYNSKGRAQHLGGVLFAIRRGICEKIPEDIVNDDAYIGILCLMKGYRVAFEENAIALFRGPATVSDYTNQRRRVVYGHLRVKRETKMAPAVLESSPLSVEIGIVAHWLEKNLSMIRPFLAACLLESVVNLLARIDLWRGNDIHKVWKIATTTKKPISKPVFAFSAE
jgi:biofilm PGA synthesis N-glycosyltransferase PgaC